MEDFTAAGGEQVVLGREGKDVWDWDAMPGGGIGGGPACDPFPGAKETGV